MSIGSLLYCAMLMCTRLYSELREGNVLSLHTPPRTGLTENMVTGDNEKRSKTDAYRV